MDTIEVEVVVAANIHSLESKLAHLESKRVRSFEGERKRKQEISEITVALEKLRS